MQYFCSKVISHSVPQTIVLFMMLLAPMVGCDPLADAGDGQRIGISAVDDEEEPATARTGQRSTNQSLLAARNYSEMRSVDTSGLTDGTQISVASRTFLGDEGGGRFVWNAADVSSKVNSDPESGVYVAPSADTSGASGAWIRQYRGPVSPAWFGPMTTPAERTTALHRAVAFGEPVNVVRGEYSVTTITTDDAALYMERGVVFKIPDGLVTSANTSGPAALLIAGDNITVEGDFTCDGNKTNNDATSFSTDSRQAVLEITGDNARINGTVRIVDAYFAGFHVGNGNDPGDEINGFYLHRLEVEQPVAQAALIWSVENWRIDSIKVRSSSLATAVDNRIRIGTSGSAQTYCRQGSIGYIDSDNTIVFESKTEDVVLDSALCSAIKFEDNKNITVGSVIANGDLKEATAWSFGYNGSENVHVGSVLVTGHNGLARATVFTGGMKNCSVGTLKVIGTITPQTDCMIRTVDGLTIGSLILESPVTTNNMGLHLDYDGSTHNNVRIGNIISQGHALRDIEWESGFTNLSIGSINPDADFGPTGRRALSFPSGIEAACDVNLSGTVPTVNENTDYNIAGVVRTSPGAFTINFDGPIVGSYFEFTATDGTVGLASTVRRIGSTRVSIILRDTLTQAGRDPTNFKFRSYLF